jgi:hypothetical protein
MIQISTQLWFNGYYGVMMAQYTITVGMKDRGLMWDGMIVAYRNYY